MEETHIETPLGTAIIKGDAEGIRSITVSDEGIKSHKAPPDTLKQASEQLHQYFKEGRKEFSFKLNPQGTSFQKRVWQKLLEIPYGKTISYLELSKQLGDVKAIRAAAAANGKNPIWIVIPCHRVIGSTGKLVGYAGGLERKRALLDLEGSSA